MATYLREASGLAVQRPEAESYGGGASSQQGAVGSNAAFCVRLLKPYSGSGCSIPAVVRPRFMSSGRTVAASSAAAGGVAGTLALPGGAKVSCTFVPCLSRLQGAGWQQVHSALQLAPGDVLQFSQEAEAAGGSGCGGDDSGQGFSMRLAKLPRPAAPAAARQARRQSQAAAAVVSENGRTASWPLPAGCGTGLHIPAAALDPWGVHGDTECSFVTPGGQQWDSCIFRRPGHKHGAVKCWAEVAEQLQPCAGDTITMRAGPLQPLVLHLSLARAGCAAAAGGEPLTASADGDPAQLAADAVADAAVGGGQQPGEGATGAESAESDPCAQQLAGSAGGAGGNGDAPSQRQPPAPQPGPGEAGKALGGQVYDFRIVHHMLAQLIHAVVSFKLHQVGHRSLLVCTSLRGDLCRLAGSRM